MQPDRADLQPIRNRLILMELDPHAWTSIAAVDITPDPGWFTKIDSAQAKHGWNAALGFEDARLVCTPRGSSYFLSATASAQRLETGMIEIVVLEISEIHGRMLDGDVKILSAQPLRGEWSTSNQKNWAPFSDADPLRVLYSPLAGGVHGFGGRVVDTHAPISLEAPSEAHRGQMPRHMRNGSMDVQIRHNGYASQEQKIQSQARLALRGGTQLVRIPDAGAIVQLTDYVRERGAWLGLAHGCRIGMGKTYWHTWYLVDYDGNLLAISEPFKLDPLVGIEFAAGMAINPDTGELAISYGIEDDSAWLGVTTLAAALSTLTPIATTTPTKTAPGPGGARPIQLTERRR